MDAESESCPVPPLLSLRILEELGTMMTAAEDAKPERPQIEAENRGQRLIAGAGLLEGGSEHPPAS